jgi:mono/diheme cytochrome c family protein
MKPRAPMSDGERLYLDKCTACHQAYEPHQYSPTRWIAAIDQMQSDGRIVLTDEERAEILGYVTGAKVAQR